MKCLNYKIKQRSNNQSGMVALLTIVIIASASLIMAINSSFLGLGELDLGYTASEGGSAFYVADSCIEETLERIRKNINYGVGTGTINLTMSNGSCTIDVSNNGNDRTIIVLGTNGDFNSKIEVALTLTGNAITINSWEEKDN